MYRRSSDEAMSYKETTSQKGLMRHKERFNEILNIYNYYNMAIIVDDKGVIEYFYNNRPDINSITEQELLGHNILESCVNITEETSTLYYAIKTGKAIKNAYQKLETSKGDTVYSLLSTMPIKEGDKIIGAVEVSKYIDIKAADRHSEKGSGEDRQDAFLSGKPLAGDNILIDDFTVEKDKLYGIDDIKGTSKEIERLKFKIRRVADTDSTVLIYGETGTGKELVAEAIHSTGKRKNKKFVSQNCAAIPPTLLESILFGTEKGSFTGAENRKGIIESAQGGTLFLDEINTMGVDTQSKILKAIEEKKIMRVGGTESVPVDVRVIAAVNVNPKECLRNGTLREDLYYRLRVVELRLPPLRERKGDIPALTEYFIKYFNSTMGRYIAGISNELKKEIMEYDWPGNVRELRNVIERGFNMAVTPIIESRDVDLFDRIEPARREDLRRDGDKTLKELVDEKEKEIIEKVYSSSRNITEAAGILKISRQGLSKKLIEYGIDIK